MDKILTIAIPCYNSQDYVRRALDTVVTSGDKVEVIVVDDGSVDATGEIVQEYVEQYPDIVRYVRKENGGHGDAVMTGIREAKGRYFYVLDSDDWLDAKELTRIVDKLSIANRDKVRYDMVIVNYVYEKVTEKHPRTIHYRSAMPVGRAFGWEETNKFRIGQYITMHSAIYRTTLLQSCGLRLPKHTFYVDNLFVYYPLPFVKKLIYFDVDLYHYFIGREDQSVNEKRLMERIDQQVLVTNTMLGMHELDQVESPRLRRYMSQYNTIMTVICSALYAKIGTPDALNKKRKFWERVKSRYAGQYKYMQYQILVVAVRGNSAFTTWITKRGYDLAKVLFHFN